MLQGRNQSHRMRPVEEVLAGGESVVHQRQLQGRRVEAEVARKPALLRCPGHQHYRPNERHRIGQVLVRLPRHAAMAHAPPGLLRAAAALLIVVAHLDHDRQVPLEEQGSDPRPQAPAVGEEGLRHHERGHSERRRRGPAHASVCGDEHPMQDVRAEQDLHAMATSWTTRRRTSTRATLPRWRR